MPGHTRDQVGVAKNLANRRLYRRERWRRRCRRLNVIAVEHGIAERWIDADDCLAGAVDDADGQDGEI
jgi:hypothetical protein